MKDFTRLFDILKYQETKYPRYDCLNFKYDGAWRNYSTAEVNEIINNISKAFISHGFKKDDKVAIISNNRPEWNFIDNGMLQAGIVNVPIYPTISKDEYEYIFNHAEIKMVFVSDKEMYDKVAAIKDAVPSLTKIYSFDKIDDCEHWETFVSSGSNIDFTEVEKVSKDIDSEDVASIIYTSGTTGKPKGVMLTHNNIISNVKAILSILPIDKSHKALSFLPLCHIFERTVNYTYLATGIGCYYAESLDTISDNLNEIKPHFFTTVPRLLEKVYEKIVSKGMELSGIKKSLFFWALNIAKNYDENYEPGLKFKIADKLIFSKWREALGGNVIGIVTGAAALQERLARVFSAAGLAVREGYGQTESSPVISVNRFDKGEYKFGTVGMPLPGVEVKIAENGEILCKGPNVMKGYYKLPEETAKTIKDGWLYTGDIGEMVDNNRFLKITDRVKALFKTSGGKYVAPQVIEEKMKESRFIEEIMVVGENKKFVSALILPSFVNLIEWCEKKKIDHSDKDKMINTPEVLSLIKKEVEKYNEHFSKVEKIKKFELLSDEWSIETGELTPTMKVKRKIVLEKYKDVIDKIYDV